MASPVIALLDEALVKLDKILSTGNAAAPASAPAPACEPASVTPQPAPAPAPAAAPVAASKTPAANAPPANSALELFSKVLIKVARVLTVEAVENSEKLYKLSIDVGGETRQVCAGLQQFVPKAELEGRLVAAVCNLKPAKLAGNLSEAMLLAAETQPAEGSLVVRLLEPPAGSAPGEQVYLQGGSPSLDTPKTVKSDHWKVVSAVLRVGSGNAATVDGTAIVTQLGAVTLPSDIPEGAAIH